MSPSAPAPCTPAPSTGPGTLHCWGNDWAGRATPPAGRFALVSAGERHTCAITTGGRIACWGYSDASGLTTPPPGVHVALSAGQWHTCALAVDKRVTCWGPTAEAAPTPPDTYTALSAGERHTCAITTGGRIACWPGAGEHHACDDEGCWPGYDDPLDLHADRSPNFAFSSSSFSGGDCCVYYVLWEAWADSRATPPPGAYVAISAGTHHTCALRPDRTIACWSSHAPRPQPAGADTNDA